ncbi:MAG: hypothetical protein GF411_19195 [Candidatus Lokiarchaeota archaeon]|nr:hypothetical protein [Candidatus Lokiarchaeota archaeon]
MNDQKYLVHFETSDILFPDECPICGRHASKTSSIISTMKDWTRVHSVWYFNRGMKGSVTIRKEIQVPVCEEHHIDFHDSVKMKGIFSLIMGLLMVFFLFIGAVIFFYAVDLVVLPLPWYVTFLALGSAIVIGFWASGPSRLEKFVAIEKIMVGSQEVILKFKNLEYAKKVLRLNGDTAKPLRVSRPESPHTDS